MNQPLSATFLKGELWLAGVKAMYGGQACAVFAGAVVLKGWLKGRLIAGEAFRRSQTIPADCGKEVESIGGTG